jgi:anti-sigma factor RsiW
MRGCEGYQLAASYYVDGELKPSERADLFGHVAKCEQCAWFLEQAIRIRLELATGRQHQSAKEIIPLPMHTPNQPTIQSARRKILPVLMQRLAWSVHRRRISIPVPIAAATIILLIAGSLALSSLWLKTQTIYVTTFPAVEVRPFTP